MVLRPGGRDLLAHTLVIVGALGGAWWLFRAGAPMGHDLTMHLFRVQALDQHLHEGVLFPRWFDNFVFGHGYPLLHFYAPLFYYLAVGFHWVGLDYVAAFKAVCLLSRVVGGLATYHLGRAKFDSRLAGLIAGLAFLFTSYQYTDLFVRVAIPELLALNLLPLGLLAVDRIAERPSRKRVAAGGGILALLVLAHQTTAVTSAAVLGAYAVFCLIACQRSRCPLRPTALVAGQIGAAGLIAVGVTAFFWLPALADRHTVRLELLPPGFPPFVEQLLVPDELVQRSLIYQHGHPAFLHLSLVETALFLIGLLTAIAGSTRFGRGTLLFFALSGFIFAFAMTAPSRPLWEALPFATLMQFPFRLRMYVSLSTAVLIAGLACLKWKRLAWLISLGALTALAVSSFSAVQPQTVEIRPDAISQASFARFELSNRWPFIGTTVPTQFLPRWVSIPDEEISRYRQPTRATGAANLETAVSVVSRRGHELTLATSAESDFTLRYHGFYFPGWRANVDGRPVAIAPDGPKALVSLPVPAGSHRINLSFGRTPLWTAAHVLSALSVGVAVFLVLTLTQSRDTALSPPHPGQRDAWGTLPSPRPERALALTSTRERRRMPHWGAAVISLALSGLLIAMPHLFSARSPTVHPANVAFDAGLTLSGWTARQENRPSGPTLNIDLYWFAQRDIASDHEITVQIRDARGQLLTSYHRPPRWGSMPTPTWSQGELVRDTHEVPLPKTLKGGPYGLSVGLQRPGGADAASHHLGTVELVDTPPSTPAPTPPDLHQKTVALANGMTLLGYRVDADLAGKANALRPGGWIAVTLLWQARDEITEDSSVAVFLADHQSGKYGLRHSYPPHDLEFTAAWRKGETYVQRFELPIPDDLTPGIYWLSLEASEYESGRLIEITDEVAPDGMARIPLERFKVAPQVPAPPQHAIGQRIGDAIVLDGYDLSAQRAQSGKVTQIEVGLHWRTIEASSEDYTVFVHLYDQSGRLIAQHDGPPRDGLYPTSAWAPSEIVLDQHRITIDPAVPPGSYTLKAGLYQPATGRRLPAASESDSVELGTVTID